MCEGAGAMRPTSSCHVVLTKTRLKEKLVQFEEEVKRLKKIEK